MTSHPIVPFPRHLLAPGTDGRPYEPVLDLDALPPGAMRRVTRGELDLLLVHTPEGIVVTDDRCPHMSAPLSIGELDGCVVACPLHEGRFHPSLGGIGPCREPHLQPAPLVAIGARREHEQRARVGWRDPVPCRATRLRAHGGATDQLHAPRLSVRRPRRVARGGGGGSDEHERHKRRDGEPPHPRSLIARRVIRHHPRQAINQAGLDR